LLRTTDYVNLLVYGGPEAIAMGRRLRAIHKGFRGTLEDGQPYYALEPEAYAWVHATLLATYVKGHAMFGTPMRHDQVERFYSEYRGLGRLIGVRERDLPGDWASFEAYFDRMCATELVRTESLDRVIRSTQGDVPPPLPMPKTLWSAVRLPARRSLWLGGVGLLSPELRERFGLRWTEADERQFQTIGRLSRSLGSVLPKPLRIAGPGQLRIRRGAIGRGPLGAGRGVRRPVAAAPAGTAAPATPATPAAPATPATPAAPATPATPAAPAAKAA
jgi:uncharacterized protein (DUF2236 family)